MIKGIPSTMNDEWQLNIHKILEHSAIFNSITEIISDRRLQGGNLHRLTYGEVYKRVKNMALALENELNVRPGEVIGILGWNDHRYFESYFSIPSIGAVLLTMNIRLHPTELNYISKHVNMKGLLVDESLIPLAETLAKENDYRFIIIMSDKPVSEIKTNLPKVYGYEELIKSYEKGKKFEEIDEKTAAIAATTSGTTGMPKVVFYSHRSITLHAMNVAIALGIKPTDVALQIVPMFHATGWGGPFAYTLVGAKQIFPGRYTPDTLAEYLVKEKVTVTAGVPTILAEIARRLENLKPNLSNLRIICGGSEPSVALLKKYAEFGATLIQGYGATETSPLVSIALPKPELEVLPLEERFLRMKQGLVTFGVEVRVVDPSSGS
ncbi:MAG: AMP-binding protein, partial [Sulfolobaceae archaeon]